jgi:adenylate cyclase
MTLVRRRKRPDFAAEGLLKGLRGKRREARAELLKDLFDAGVPLEELRQAVAEDRLALLPVQLVLAEDSRYTVAEVAEKSGIEVELLIEQRRAAGLPVADPDERAYSKADLEAARRFGAAIEAGISREAMIEAARVFGRAASQAASATRNAGSEAFLRKGDTERDLGLRFAEAMRTLHPQTLRTLEYLYETHLREQIRSDVIALAALTAGRLAGTSEVTVCFADLVGFTRLGELLAPEDLGEVATRFSKLAEATVREPVSLVKMIGDAAMLVASKPEPVIETALDLVEAADAEGEDFPQLKAGVARGEAMSHFGDWYGAPVNLASRVTGIAYPGSVLATLEVQEAAPDYHWSSAGRRKLKGVGENIPLYRCRRPEST